MSLYRCALTIPGNCNAWDTCSSLYQRLNAASLSAGMVAFTMNRIVAMNGTPGVPVASRLVDEADLHAAVVAALVVDLEDADAARAAGGREMRAAAGLPVESDDLDDAHAAVGRGRRRHRAATDQPGLGREGVGGDPGDAQRQVLADDVVELRLQRAQPVVVHVGKIEVRARRTVVVQLGAGDERALEHLEDERVEHVGVGVQLGLERAERRIDRRLYQ